MADLLTKTLVIKMHKDIKEAKDELHSHEGSQKL